MRKFVAGVVAAFAVFGAMGAQAAQFTIPADVWIGDNRFGASYFGPGYTSGNSYLGTFGRGGGTYPFYGLLSNAGNLTITRRTEAFQDLNLYRLVDTFTNNTSAPITRELGFQAYIYTPNNLGYTVHQEKGLYVTCTNAGQGLCDGPPVAAHISGNVGASRYFVDNTRYIALFNVTINPGESISLLNYAFLARETNDPRPPAPSDVPLAINRGKELLANPYLDGLSTAERARVVNWDFSKLPTPGPVPEPAMIGLLGLAAVAIGVLRRRKTA